MVDIVAVKRKIRALLATAHKDSGATQAEKSTARALADSLMARYKLRESDIPLRSIDLGYRRASPRPSPGTIRVNVSFGFEANQD